MTILETMIMAHLIGDWLLQTEWQAQNKATNWTALLIHIIIYHLVMFAFLYLSFDFALMPLGISVGFLALTHSILDRQKFVGWLMRTLRIRVVRDNQKWLSVAVDQALHILLMGVATLYLSKFIS